MSRRIGIAGVLWAWACVAWAEPIEWTISPEEWAQPRSGAVMVALPGLNAAVQAWLADSAAMLVLAHPPGEDGEVWASELRGWLVALGVPARRIVIQADQASAMILRLAQPLPTRALPPATETLEIIPAVPAPPWSPETPLSFEVLEQP